MTYDELMRVTAESKTESIDIRSLRVDLNPPENRPSRVHTILGWSDCKTNILAERSHAVSDALCYDAL